MPIDIQSEQLLTLSQACRLLPHRPSPSTLWRWRTIGVRGVRLECLKISSRWVTTARCMSEFLQRQADAYSQSEPNAADSSAPSSESMKAKLDDAGLLPADESEP